MLLHIFYVFISFIWFFFLFNVLYNFFCTVLILIVQLKHFFSYLWYEWCYTTKLALPIELLCLILVCTFKHKKLGGVTDVSLNIVHVVQLNFLLKCNGLQFVTFGPGQAWPWKEKLLCNLAMWLSYASWWSVVCFSLSEMPH